MKIAIAIPARLNSTRLKHKMLIKFKKKPLIRRVYDNVAKWGYDTYVVTDSKRIAEVIPKKAVRMTTHAENGTHRLGMRNWKGYDYVINIQGDMIDICERTMRPIFKSILEHKPLVLTAYTRGSKPTDVKIIHNAERALWFTRQDLGYGDRHLGIYAYRTIVLKSYKYLLDFHSKEDLEQNRMLGHYPMHAVETIYKGHEINTQDDIDSWAM